VKRGCTPGRRRQRGAALVTAAVLMLAVMLLGFSSVRAALGDMQSGRHERDRQIALWAADAGLLDAERELAATPASSPRFAALAGAGFIPGCGVAGTGNHGLCTRAAPPAPPSWQVIDLASDDPALVVYGTYTARDLPGVARQPRYLIESIPLNPAYGRYYRVTAIGFGQLAGTRVVLQSFYRKAPMPASTPPQGSPGATTAPPAASPPVSSPAPAPASSPTIAGAGPPAATGPPAGAGPPVLPAALPEQRIGWREVANWPALHAAAIH
jgi:type IV pilus assembly protein PilX